MAQFERFDICLAHQALENDWNKGGWLRERPSNVRRNEATSVQLARMQFRAGMGDGGTFSALEDNAKDIYVDNVVAFGLAARVDRDDELGQWIANTFVPEYLDKHFRHFDERSALERRQDEIEASQDADHIDGYDRDDLGDSPDY